MGVFTVRCFMIYVGTGFVPEALEQLPFMSKDRDAPKT